MPGIIDYIKWRGDLDFDTCRFNPVDNLIFAELSYMSFLDIIDSKRGMRLCDAANKYLDKNNDENLGLLLTGEFRLLLELLGKSNRFGKVRLKNCVEIIDEDIEMQFAAMVIEIDRDNAYIAFRGTDDHIIGWKEDFKMSFLDVVPAQKEALDYLNKVAGDYKHIYIGGHSKGGNLAVYSAVYADEKIKKKIINVYNNDGPGFKQRLLDTKEYMEITDRVITLVPQSSVVGMLLEHEESYKVVKSTQKGVLQHDGFSWEVLGADFVYLSDVDDDCRMVDMALKNVLNSMDLQQREEFINVMFGIISINENRTLMDIKKDGLKSLHTMTKNYNQLDKKTRKAVSDTISLFFGEGFRSFREVKNEDQWDVKFANFKKKVPQRFSKYLHEKDTTTS